VLSASLTLWAQPASLPPAPPAFDPSNVVWVYPNSSLADIQYNPGWGQSTTVNPNYAVEGSTVLQYANFNYQGTQFSEQSVTDMTCMHIDIWSQESFTANIYPINAAGGAGGGVDDQQKYALNLSAGQWNTFDIPLSTFTRPLYSLFQFKFDGGAGQTFYITNWYFYNENTTSDTEAPASFTAVAGEVTKSSVELLLNAGDNSGAVAYTITYGSPIQTITIGGQAGVQRSYTVSGLNPGTPYTFTVSVEDRSGNSYPTPLTVNETTLSDLLPAPIDHAPTPTVTAADVISVFSSAYTSPSWFNYGSWGQSTTHSSVTIDGVSTMKLESFNYQGFEFAGAGGPLNVSGMEFLHIDVWTPNETRFQIGIADPTVACTPLVQGTWNSYDIPIESLTGTNDLTAIQTMKLVGSANLATPATTGTTTVYVDNIYFFKEGATGLNAQAADNVSVYAVGGTLFVAGAKDAVVVFNGLGQVVYQHASAENLSVALTKGLYIVKIGATTKKIVVQ
jgi:hypothetical protein